MRKGRSQRKTRGSLPPLSVRPHAASATADASAPRSRGPQVVIGLTAPRSEDAPETLETLETLAASPASAAPARRAAARLEILAEPTLALVKEQDLEPRAVADPFALALTEETPAPPAPHTSALLTPDEISIPPIGDLAVEPVVERFFSEGELVAAHADGEEEESWDPAQDKVQRKSLPHVIERRQRFSRYVLWAVSGAAIVCFAAVGRTLVMPHHAPAAAAAQAIAAPEPVRAPEPVAVVAAPRVDVPKAETLTAEALKVDEPTPGEPKPAEAKAAEAKAGEAKPGDAPKTDEAKPVVAAAAGDKTALQEKNDARRNLERGKLAEAIEAGERSVATDPQDGEAWLLLGAAYQEKGKTAEARRAYTSCLKEGKRGPLGECRAMLR